MTSLDNTAQGVDAGPPAFAGAGFARHDDYPRQYVVTFGSWYQCRTTLTLAATRLDLSHSVGEV